MPQKLRMVHLIPGVESSANSTLVSESIAAVFAAERARANFAGSWDVRIVVAGENSLPDELAMKVEAISTPVQTLRLGESGARPFLGSYLRPELVRGADYVVFSNADIIVGGKFYDFVVNQIRLGRTSGAINRRTVHDVLPLEQLDMAAERAERATKTTRHPGSDCFYFPSTTLESAHFGSVAMGLPPVGRATLLWVSAADPNFKEFRNENLTYHFGDPRNWREFPEISRHIRGNVLNWIRTWPRTINEFGLKNFWTAVRVVGRRRRYKFFLRVLQEVLGVRYRRVGSKRFHGDGSLG